jgi:hypothetical protein
MFRITSLTTYRKKSAKAIRIHSRCLCLGKPGNPISIDENKYIMPLMSNTQSQIVSRSAAKVLWLSPWPGSRYTLRPFLLCRSPFLHVFAWISALKGWRDWAATLAYRPVYRALSRARRVAQRCATSLSQPALS